MPEVYSLLLSQWRDIFILSSLFFFFWLRWVFVAACGFSLVTVHGLLIARASTGSRHVGFSSCGVRTQ